MKLPDDIFNQELLQYLTLNNLGLHFHLTQTYFTRHSVQYTQYILSVKLSLLYLILC